MKLNFTKKHYFFCIMVTLFALAMIFPYGNAPSNYQVKSLDLLQLGEAMVVIDDLEVTEAQKIGQDLFIKKCANCHGNAAVGKFGIAPPLVHKIYEPSHHPDQAFYRAAKYGARAHHWPFGDMPAVENGISDTEISKIISYIRALQKHNKIF